MENCSNLVNLLPSVKLYKCNIIVAVRVYQNDIHNNIYIYVYIYMNVNANKKYINKMYLNAILWHLCTVLSYMRLNSFAVGGRRIEL